MNKNPLRILDSKSMDTQKVLKNAPKISDYISQDSLNMLETVKETFPNENIEIDHSLVRGLDYYTGFIFEAVSDDLGAQDAYLGGGRYDQLFEELGGKKLPAIGMAIGIERLAEISKNTSSRQTLISFMILSDKIQQKAYKIAHDLRSLNKDIVFEVSLGEGSLKSKLRRANKDKASYAIILGDEELASETILLKSLQEDNSDQKKLTLNEIKKFISSI